jgi:hypothetical protein
MSEEKFQALIQQLENLAGEFNNNPQAESKKVSAIIYALLGFVNNELVLDNFYRLTVKEVKSYLEVLQTLKN